MSTITSDLETVAQTAKDRIATDLGRNSNAGLLEFCGTLVDWVVYGRRKPVGSPTARVQSAVRAAVNVGLREVYGSESSPRIDSKLVIRLEFL